MKKVRIINVCAFAAVFIFMLIMNSRVGYLCDDWRFKYILHSPDYDFQWEGIYKTMLPEIDETPVNDMSDVLLSAKNYYLTFGGRVVNHFCLFVVLNFMGKSVFNVLNSLVFALLGCFIYRIAAAQEREKVPWLLPLVYLFTLTLPSIGSSVFWLSGSFNYLWPATLMTGCFLVMKKLFYGESRPLLAVMYLVMLLSASTNEVTGGMICVLLFCWFLKDEKKKRHLPRYLISLAVCAAGELIVLIAPGNMARANRGGREPFNISNVLSVSYSYLRLLFSNYGWAVVLLVLYAVLLFGKLKKDLFYDLSFAVTSLAGFTAFGVSATFYKRVAFLPSAILGISVAIAAARSYITIKEGLDETTYSYLLQRRERLTLIVLGLFVLVWLMTRQNDIFLILSLFVIAAAFAVIYFVGCKSKGVGFTAKGYISLVYRRAPFAAAAMALVPLLYFLIYGKRNMIAVYHYISSTAKVLGVFALVCYYFWNRKHGKNKTATKSGRMSEPLNKLKALLSKPHRVLSLKLVGILTGIFVIVSAGAIVENVACAIPYYAKQRAIERKVTDAVARGDKEVTMTDVYFYDEKGGSYSYMVDPGLIDPSMIQRLWMERIYDITINVDLHNEI